MASLDRRSVRAPHRRLSAALVGAGTLAAAALGAPSLGAAAPQESTADAEEGRRLYSTGRDLSLTRRCNDALPLLQRSHELSPSPNSSLLIARCLRDLGKVEEAARRFEATSAEAEARSAAGDGRYTQTASAARLEGAKVRATLGVLRVRAPAAPPGTVVETDVGHAALGPDGTAEILHRPGEVSFMVQSPGGGRTQGTATVTAGNWKTVDVVLPSGASSSSAGAAAWRRPTAFVAGGLGIAAMGVFIGAGLHSRAIFRDLSGRCAPHCGPLSRPAAQEGKLFQALANVSLAVGVVGLGAGVTFFILSAPRGRNPPPAYVAIGPRSAVFAGVF